MRPATGTRTPSAALSSHTTRCFTRGATACSGRAMIGEDALQDALLRAWRGLCGFNGRSGFRWWLYQIATNACLDALARRTKRVRVFDDVDSAEELDANGVVGLEEAYTTPEARYEELEAVELAVVAALQYLTPKQRAALVLRDVLSFSAKEAAESLGTTVPSVNSALQRARKAVEERLPETSRAVDVEFAQGRARE